MKTKEEVREIIALTPDAEMLAKSVFCYECPYGIECEYIANGSCAETLRQCNADYIEELNKSQGENEMTTMLPDNTVQINPQGEIEGLDSLSLDDLRKLSKAAHELLDRKSDEHEQQLWDNVVKAVKEYCKECGDIEIVYEDDDSLIFNHTQMDSCGVIDCE